MGIVMSSLTRPKVHPRRENPCERVTRIKKCSKDNVEMRGFDSVIGFGVIVCSLEVRALGYCLSS